MSLCLGPSTIIGTITTAILGVMSPDQVKTYVGVTLEPYDSHQLDFNEPIDYLLNIFLLLFGVMIILVLIMLV